MSNQFIRNAVVTVTGHDGVGRRIKDARFQFKVEKTSEYAPNQLELQVYNLARSTRSVFEKKDNRILLEAGYGKDLKGVFFGNITKSENGQHDRDFISKITAGDGDSAYQNSNINVSFKAGTPLKDMMGQLTSTFQGLTQGQQSGIPEGVTEGSTVMSGPSHEVMTKFAEAHDLEWSIQDGALTIAPKHRLAGEGVVFLSKDTGLIGWPSKKDVSGIGALTSQFAIEIKCLLRPEIRPGRPVKIESENVKGNFLVRKVVHEGDTNSSGPWFTTFEVQQ